MGPELGHFLDSLGWAIVHSVWQGALAAIAVVIFRNLTKDSHASLRYGFQVICLIGTLAAFLTTFTLYQLRAPSNISITFQTGAVFEPISALLNQKSALPEGRTFSDLLTLYMPFLGVLWCLGFALLAARYSGAFIMTQRLRRLGLSDAPAAWQSRFHTLVLNAGLRRDVRIFISNRVSGPLTLGFFKPIVLVPASFFTGLTAPQVEAILLHEIAHIRRHDYLINLFQTAVKSIFFFHPAIHYISRRIDQDREHACDDFAVALTRDPQALARGLAALRLNLTPKTFALAADNGNTPLVARLKRLGNINDTRRRPEHVLTSAATLLIAAGLYVFASPLADAHQPASLDTDNADTHPSKKSTNYYFEQATLNGQTFTVKVAEDGSRWINVNGAWYDVDKNPDMIGKLPQAPEPPKPPASYSDDSQYAVDMDYYIAQLRQSETPEDMPELAGKPHHVPNVHNETAKAELTRNRIERIVDEALTEGMKERDNAWDEAKKSLSQSSMAPGLYIDGEYFDAPDAKSWTHEFEKAMAKINKDVIKGRINAEQAQEARDRAEESLEARIEQVTDLREAAHDRAQEQRERALERAEEQRERAIERAEEQHERAMERAEEQRERAMERAMERAEEAREKAHAFDEAMLSQLKADKLISQDAKTVTISFPNKAMAVNGTLVSNEVEGNYCDILETYGIEKNSNTEIKITFGAFTHKTSSQNKRSSRQSYESGMANAHSENMQLAATPISIKLPPLPFINPAPQSWVSQSYSALSSAHKSHGGIDLASPRNTTINASAPGLVTYAKTKGKWGNMVKIKHKDGYETHYAHVGEICVDEGKTVNQGDPIGLVGSTGASSAPHLHFEIRQHGQSLNPEKMITGT
ncbi:MAG: M56 family metallopeptidase [Alphaproteobacteria bacterium]